MWKRCNVYIPSFTGACLDEEAAATTTVLQKEDELGEGDNDEDTAPDRVS